MIKFLVIYNTIMVTILYWRTYPKKDKTIYKPYGNDGRMIPAPSKKTRESK